MNCPCDQLIFPPPHDIPAGLKWLPLQIASFPEFRQAMLHAISTKPALRNWRARSSDDFGIMLLEMWAYVCDSTAFYREVIGNEEYLPTAQLLPSLRKLIGLLGYIPRPASGAIVDLAAFADGRQPVLLPQGTAFRSGAFPGSAPQVFELNADTKIHPVLNQWTLAKDRPTSVDAGENYSSLGLHYVWAQPKTVTTKAGDSMLVTATIPNGSVTHAAASVLSVADFPAMDGVNYKQIQWTRPVSMPGSTLLANLQLQVPTQKATLWKSKVFSPPDPSVIDTSNSSATKITLDGIYRNIPSGQIVILSKGSDLRWFYCAFDEESRQFAAGTTATLYAADGTTPTGTISTPPVQTNVTVLTLDADINNPSRKSTGGGTWTANDAASIVVRYGFQTAAVPIMPAFTSLIAGDALQVPIPIEVPADGSTASVFQLEDKNNLGLEISGTLNFTNGALTLDQGSSISETLAVPVQLYGNVLTASRGETVPSELLGIGDATILNQSFTLKKKPLTYTPSATAGNEQGVASTLKVYVDGLQWSEVPSFYGVPPTDQVYIVRQNDNGESVVTFGDSLRGMVLSTGALVTATYRFGAGALAPPAGSINQIGKPFKGLKSVRNPVAAGGGADAETGNLQTNAPASALLLGRAISIQDITAAAANVPGVRAVRAEWRWNDAQQRPVVQIWYIGAASVAKEIKQTLRGLTDPTVPISVDEATSVPSNLAISIEIDTKRLSSDVLTAVRTALTNSATGMLAPENIGIGVALFRSQIFEAVLAVPGAIAVDGLLWNGAPFDPYGIVSNAGTYFDLENGVLTLN